MATNGVWQIRNIRLFASNMGLVALCTWERVSSATLIAQPSPFSHLLHFLHNVNSIALACSTYVLRQEIVLGYRNKQKLAKAVREVFTSALC